MYFKINSVYKNIITLPVVGMDLIRSPVSESDITSDIASVDIALPNKWVLYLYDKQLFKKMANRSNFQAKPYKELCVISTVNDLIYLLRLMEVPIETNGSKFKLNMDTNDYIIMREGIEPIWEDPKNSDGGTFTIKMNHENGYDVWSTFVMYMLGETLTADMNIINGITVSYISDTNTKNQNFDASVSAIDYTYIKIWDGKPGRTRDQFVHILPHDLIEKIQNESLDYFAYKGKNKFNEPGIIAKLNNNKQSYSRERERGGFISRGRGRR